MTTRRQEEKNKIEKASVKKKATIDNHLREKSKAVRFKVLNLGGWAESHADYIQNDINDIVNHTKRRHLYFNEGSIVKVDFGMNVGSEISGDHYAIVLDKSDNNSKDKVTVVPLTSKKWNGYVPLDMSFANSLLNSIRDRKTELEDCMKRFYKVHDDLINHNKNGNHDGFKKALIQFLKVDYSYFCELLNYTDERNGQSLYDEINAGNLLECLDLINNTENLLVSYNKMIEEVELIYLKSLNSSYAIVNNIVTVSKTRIRNKINRIDPIGSIVIGDKELTTIRTEMNKKLGNKHKKFWKWSFYRNE